MLVALSAPGGSCILRAREIGVLQEGYLRGRPGRVRRARLRHDWLVLSAPTDRSGEVGVGFVLFLTMGVVMTVNTENRVITQYYPRFCACVDPSRSWVQHLANWAFTRVVGWSSRSRKSRWKWRGRTRPVTANILCFRGSATL